MTTFLELLPKHGIEVLSDLLKKAGVRLCTVSLKRSFLVSKSKCVAGRLTPFLKYHVKNGNFTCDSPEMGNQVQHVTPLTSLTEAREWE